MRPSDTINGIGALANRNAMASKSIKPTQSGMSRELNEFHFQIFSISTINHDENFFISTCGKCGKSTFAMQISFYFCGVYALCVAVSLCMNLSEQRQNI